MNLAHTDAEWLRFLGRELGYAFFAPLRLLREVRDRFGDARTQVLNLVDWNSNISSITLSGVNFGTNCTTEGRLYVRIVANGGNWDCNIYKATGGGGGDLVATATNVAASGTGTLTASNSSGLTGSVTLGSSITAETNDRHQLLCFPDFRQMLSYIFTGTDSIEDDEASRKAALDAYDRIASKLDEAIAELLLGVNRWAISAPGNPVARGNKFGKTQETGLFADGPLDDGSGTITRGRTGLFEWLRLAMGDEATGSTQDLVKRTPSAAAGVFSSANTGSGTVASHTPGQQCPASIWRFVCVDDTIGSEKFRTIISRTRTGDDRVNTDSSLLTIRKAWSGPLGFGPITLARTYTKSGDGSNVNLATVASLTVVGETAQNTNAGVLYWKIESNAANWDISFFNSSTLHSSTLVAKATNVATAAVFVAEPQNSSGLTVTWTVGSAPVTSTNSTLALNCFKTQNSQGVPDEFSVTVSVAASPGVYMSILADETNAALRGDTSGSESISDNYVKAGTFPPYAVLDN